MDSRRRRKKLEKNKNKIKNNEKTQNNAEKAGSTFPVSKRDNEIAALPWVEVGAYFIFICVMMCIVMQELHRESKAKFFKLKRYNFANGWRIFGTKKDISDTEWNHFINLLNPVNMLGILGYVLLSHLLQRHLPQFRKVFLLLYSVIGLFIILSLPTMLLLAAHIILMFVLAKTRSKYLIWAGVFFQISTLNFTSLMSPIQKFFTHEDYYVMVIIVAMTSIRCMSFGLDYCEEHTEAPQKFTLFDYITYVFYLPTFMTGPLMSYGQFYQQYNLALPYEYGKIVKETLYYFFWCYFLEVALQFLYFSAIHNEQSVLWKISPLAVGASALCHLYFFQMKYVVIYGLSRCLALVDGVNAPKPPNCIMAMYQYRDMWRYFDRGLHHILMKYIYFPFGGSKHGIGRQILGAFMCFLYVCYWHGFNRNYCYWALFNWCGIVFESVIIMVSSLKSFNTFMGFS
ncbi:protein-cysteine N-palmitoyltransferase HHAT-like [Anneissia japonica]|uniref:protein-cysteine N-palmitoyltransferase HHAT-like n=1 Tax=Anneissia japonica TaxID=1529436 RepID=UPI0014254B59|nr:protein-cysteine N-palmitoyltransferase HHAT-like [Anneissia japonica]